MRVKKSVYVLLDVELTETYVWSERFIETMINSGTVALIQYDCR